MAKTTEEVPPEPKAEPNIKEIIALLEPNGPLDKAAKLQSDGMTKTGEIFQRIEKNFNGNRAAVALIRRMKKMSDDKLADFIRTLEPLMVHYGFTLDDIEPDLVDRSGGGESGDGGGEPGGEDPEPTADGNSTTSPLDDARASLESPPPPPVERPIAAAEADAFVQEASKPVRGKPKLGIVPPSETVQ